MPEKLCSSVERFSRTGNLRGEENLAVSFYSLVVSLLSFRLVRRSLSPTEAPLSWSVLNCFNRSEKR